MSTKALFSHENGTGDWGRFQGVQKLSHDGRRPNVAATLAATL